MNIACIMEDWKIPEAEIAKKYPALIDIDNPEYCNNLHSVLFLRSIIMF